MTLSQHSQYIVHLHDEAPKIGSGVRIVEAISIGWKWVRIKSPCNTKSATKLRRSVWDSIKPIERT